jgi:hypothetical protein
MKANVHRFSNRGEVREDILFLAKHDRIPEGILNLPVSLALQFALVIELKHAIKEALA